MKKPMFVLLLAIILSGEAAYSAAMHGAPWQNTSGEPVAVSSDPLIYLTKSFPHTVEVKRNGHLLEFCPDNTCDGFVSAPRVPVSAIKDFAYLYIYFFSEYMYLTDWRNRSDAHDAATRVLSKPQYRSCKAAMDVQAARCVLLNFSRNGGIKLIFIRYDENRRNVVPEDIIKELSKKHD